MTNYTKHQLHNLYSAELIEIKGTISNEKLWELMDPVPNVHTDNIANLHDYMATLSNLIEALNIKSR